MVQSAIPQEETIESLLTTRILQFLQMEGQFEEIQELLQEVASRSMESFEESFQAQIVEAFKHFTPSQPLFRLAILCVNNYGFGVLLSLKPLYRSLTYKVYNSLKQELELIERLALRLTGNHSMASFSELDFLTQATKKNKKHQQNALSRQIMIIPSVYQRSYGFIQDLIRIKDQVSKLVKLNDQQISQIYDNYQILTSKLQAKPRYNFFEKIYHSQQIKLYTDELKLLKARLQLDKAGLSYIDDIIDELQTHKRYQPQEDNRRCGKRDSERKKFYTAVSSTSVRASAYLNVDKVPTRQNNVDESGYLNYSSHTISFHTEIDTPPTNFHPNDYITPVKSSANGNSTIIHTQRSNQLLLPQEEHRKDSNKPQIYCSVTASQPVSSHLCCRTFFYQNEIIEEPQSLRRQYKFYTLPFSPTKFSTLCKTIVGFLNSVGGIIYLGVKEESNRLRKAVGVPLNEKEKEEFLTNIRQICEKIVPDIIFARLFQIKFVPLKTSKNTYVSGKYIVKIIVQMGKPKEVYFMSSLQEGAKVAFRTQNEVLVRDPKIQLQKIIEIVKSRTIDPPRKQVVDHDGACPEPEQGLPAYGEL